MTTSITPGEIPSGTPIADRTGRVSNQWYFWLRKLAENASQATGNFVIDGTQSTFGQTTINQGLSGGLGTGTTGDIFFASDNRTIYVNIAGTWDAMIPAYSGDITNTAGSSSLQLTNVNSSPGIYTNATVVVDAKGRVTAAASGSSIGNASAGPLGTIQLATGTGLFTGDVNSFYYSADSGGPILTLGYTLLGTDDGSNPPILQFQSDVAANNMGVPQVSQILAPSGLQATGSESLLLSTATGDVTVDAGSASEIHLQTNTVDRVVIDDTGIITGEWLATTIAVTHGGTGTGTVPTNGELLIGNGTDYTVAALTAGTGISVTNGPGSITITNTSGSEDIWLPIHFGDVTVQAIYLIPANKFVISCKVIVETAFDGSAPTLSVGDVSDHGSLMTTVQNSLKTARTFQSTPSTKYLSPTQLNVYYTSTSSMTGTAYVVLTVQT